MAKRFFFVCAGILCLVFAYHLGATNAGAQATSSTIKLIETEGNIVWVVTNNDDIYGIDPYKLPNVAKGQGWWKFRLDAVK